MLSAETEESLQKATDIVEKIFQDPSHAKDLKRRQLQAVRGGAARGRRRWADRSAGLPCSSPW